MSKEIQEGQIVLCTVDRIVGTIVFVKLEDSGLEGTITFSEVSPGRIRNIRDYVFPGKKIVCKILRTDRKGLQLSLRRVKLKEKKELNEFHKKEKSYKAIIKSNSENSEQILQKIQEDFESFSDFFEKIKKDPDVLKKYISNKQEAEKLKKVLDSKKEKQKELTKKFMLHNKTESGINAIKQTLKDSIKECKECTISTIGAGNYFLKIKSKDLKKADSDLNKIIENIEKQAKQKGFVFKITKN